MEKKGLEREGEGKNWAKEEGKGERIRGEWKGRTTRRKVEINPILGQTRDNLDSSLGCEHTGHS